jgi:Fe-S cluster assembly iron-binding protein IscA
MEGVMLAVTPTAFQVIHELVERRGFPSGAGLRIATSEDDKHSCSLGLAAAPEADDEVVPIEDVGVFLEPSAAEALNGMVLDAGVGPEGKVSFSVVDPSMQ